MSLRNDIVSLWFWGYRGDWRIELQAPVLYLSLHNSKPSYEYETHARIQEISSGGWGGGVQVQVNLTKKLWQRFF